jgi:predicted Zn-dependent protease
MNHPDFRVGVKIFATLGYPDKSRGMVKLSPERQHYFSKDYPDAFAPVKGAWGRAGATTVYLKAADKKGRAAHSIAAAVLLARELDESRQPSLDDQLAALDEALAIAPGDGDVLLLHAELGLEAERYAQALADADALLADRPDELRAQAVRVRALTALGRYEEARSALQPLLESPLLPLDPELQQFEGRLDVSTGRLEEGARALQRYLRDQNSHWVEGWTMLAETNTALGRAGEAATAQGNAERTSRNQAILVHRQARAAAWRGDATSSASLLGMVLTLEPDNETARAEYMAEVAPLSIEIG